MHLPRIAIPIAICLLAAAALGQEPDCAVTFQADGKTSQVFFMTALNPQAVVARLPRLLIAAGLTMQWSDPAKGTLKADGLEVKAEQAGRATRVTFLSSVGADKDVLCRYAGFVGSPASEMPPPVPQDPSLIAQMKTDLLKKQKVLQADTGYGPSTVTFHSQDDFADFKITAVKETADERRYEISVLLPSEACILARENVDDAAAGFGGATETPKTQPVRASVSLTYRSDAGVWHLADAAISHIERTK